MRPNGRVPDAVREYAAQTRPETMILCERKIVPAADILVGIRSYRKIRAQIPSEVFGTLRPLFEHRYPMARRQRFAGINPCSGLRPPHFLMLS